MEPNFDLNPFLFCDKLQKVRTKVSHLFRVISADNKEDNNEIKQLVKQSTDTPFIPLELYCCQSKDVRRKHLLTTVSRGEQFVAQRCDPIASSGVTVKFDEIAVKLVECKSRNRYITDLNVIAYIKPLNVANDSYHIRDVSTVVVESCDAITGKVYVRPTTSADSIIDVSDNKLSPMVSFSSNQSYNEVITKTSCFKCGSKTNFVSVLFARHMAALRSETKEQPKQLMPIKIDKTPKVANSRDEKNPQTDDKKCGEKSLEDTKLALKQLLKSSSSGKSVSKRKKRRSSSTSSSSSSSSSTSSSSSSSSDELSSSSTPSSTSSDSKKKSKSKHKKRRKEKKNKKSKKKRVKKSISIKETKVTKMRADLSPLIPGMERERFSIPTTSFTRSFAPQQSFTRSFAPQQNFSRGFAPNQNNYRFTANWNHRPYGKWRNSFRPLDRQSLVERQTKRDSDMEDAIRRMSK